MKATQISVKGWKKDDGRFSWTPEIMAELDWESPTLTDKQRADVKAGINDLMDLIQESIEERSNHELGAKRARIAERIKPMAEDPKPEPKQEAEPEPKPKDLGVLDGGHMEKLPNGDVRVTPTTEPDRPAAPSKESDEPYDRVLRTWSRCPCGNTNITHKSKIGTGTYQSCSKCKVNLRADGTSTPWKGY